MGNSKDGITDGILKGLKKILFTNSGETDTEQTATKAQEPPVTSNVKAEINIEPTGNSLKESKLRIYQLLETLNKQGIDFFEVWNASIEMGGANSGNIKAAYTSLKYADKSLSKEKLKETGEFYINSLNSVLEKETIKRQDEKNQLLLQKEQEKTNGSAEINELEQQINTLQKKLADKKAQMDGINEKYQLPLETIDQKISAGRKAVDSVVNEMQQVVAIIQKEIN